MGMSRYDIALGKNPPLSNPKILIIGGRRSGKTEILLNEMMKVSGRICIGAPSYPHARLVKERYMHRMMEGRPEIITQSFSSDLWQFGESISDGVFIDEVQEMPQKGFTSGINRALSILSSHNSARTVITAYLPWVYESAWRKHIDGVMAGCIGNYQEWNRVWKEGIYEPVWYNFTYLSTEWQALFLPKRIVGTVLPFNK